MTVSGRSTDRNDVDEKGGIILAGRYGPTGSDGFDPSVRDGTSEQELGGPDHVIVEPILGEGGFVGLAEGVVIVVEVVVSEGLLVRGGVAVAVAVAV
eukprot:CAMPEP_0183313760 /NCGR_PEP_ID=MMETSP0160_2-20130417/46417_1 /TAXON_ID=2839 ORGANISM="Odontella Sinensis, Strain Grunow 1884" /NCGR_SAMPLE_ID=MMETSP0160_2 /ASSEMBLY_ACC=CAM_ASM_000250 /LENGTH=96 /DNA_ID=CAMNT_0025478915 /DNA_START=252 /DNA_END=539 /DNA_ORIENTATION=-